MCVACVGALTVQVGVSAFLVVTGGVAEVGGVIAYAAGADLVVAVVAFLKRAVLACPVTGVDRLCVCSGHQHDASESKEQFRFVIHHRHHRINFEPEG